MLPTLSVSPSENPSDVPTQSIGPSRGPSYSQSVSYILLLCQVSVRVLVFHRLYRERRKREKKIPNPPPQTEKHMANATTVTATFN
eukprot:scaffold71372_cov77-Attheya_sp.AAC.2